MQARDIASVPMQQASRPTCRQLALPGCNFQQGNKVAVDLGPEAIYKDVRCVKYERSASKVLGVWSARCSVPGWSLRWCGLCDGVVSAMVWSLRWCCLCDGMVSAMVWSLRWRRCRSVGGRLVRAISCMGCGPRVDCRMLLTSVGHSHRLDWHVWSDCLSTEGICLPPCTRAQLHRGERLMCSRLLRAGSRHHLHGKCPEVHIKTFLFWFLYWCCMERPSSQRSG
eukprot:jgi/Astpho2/2663/fgenesh1_pg.00049_%23_26_t